MEDKYKFIKHIPVILFFITTILVTAIDTNKLWAIVGLIIGLIPESLRHFIKKPFFESQEYKIFLQSFYFSAFFFYIGYFFSLSFHSINQPSIFVNGSILSGSFISYFIFLFAAFVFWALSKDISSKKNAEILFEESKIILEKTRNFFDNGPMPIEKFIETAKEKQANVLAVAGNLKGLNTEKGVELLLEFINNDIKNNKLELFIPESSKETLKEINMKINNPEIEKRVEIMIVDPFVFLQGIVVAAESNTKNPIPFTKGYYLYKPILKADESLSEEGIFVDVSDDRNEDQYTSIAIGAYYKHLNNENYPLGDNELTFIPGILNLNKDVNSNDFERLKHNTILEKFTLDQYDKYK